MKCIFFLLCVLFFAVTGFTSDEGLVSYWNFEEEGIIVKDRGPAGIDGRIEGNVERTEGIIGKALSFPGDLNSHVVFHDKEALDLREAFTLSAWIYRNDTGTRWDGIIINGRHNHGFQVFYAESTQKLTLYLHTDEKPYHPLAGGYIPMYEWMHIAVTYDGREVRLYQNGMVTGRQGCTGMVGPFPEAFYLGSAVHPFNAFRGLIDEVKIYSRALSEEEIIKYYQETAPENHNPSEEPVPAFKNLHAERTEEGILLSFDITEEYLEEDNERKEKIEVSIYRNSHPRNDTNPGVNNGILIFSGNLESHDDGKYTYLDTEPLEHGYTYYHWVSPDGSNFRVFPSKMRVYHPDIWWTPAVIRERTYELAERFPELIEVQTFGKTVQGRPLEALLIGNRERMIAFVGAIHVSESGPELILGAVEKLLEENPELLEEVGIAALPCVTLDERERKLRTGYAMYLRKNAAGVDLNRNFPAYWEELPPPGTMQTDDPNAEIYRGPAPGSEPETRAVMAFLKEVDPRVSFFFHSIGSICSAGFVSSQYAISEGDEEFVDLVEKIGRIYAHGMYGEAYTEYYWHHHTSRQGSHNVWLHKKLRSPALTLELDTYEKGQVARYDGVTPELMEEYRIRHKNAMKAVIEKIIEGEIERLEGREHPDNIP